MATIPCLHPISCYLIDTQKLAGSCGINSTSQNNLRGEKLCFFKLKASNNDPSTKKSVLVCADCDGNVHKAYKVYNSCNYLKSCMLKQISAATWPYNIVRQEARDFKIFEEKWEQAVSIKKPLPYFVHGEGAVLCSQCKGTGVNSIDHFNGQFKAGDSCWLCGGRRICYVEIAKELVFLEDS